MLPRSRRTLPLAAALLLGAAPALHAQTPDSATTDRRPTLAVLHFHNGAFGNSAQYEALSKGISDLLITDLAANKGIRLVERDRIEELLREQDLAQTPRIDNATAARLGRTLGARHMIKGSFVVDQRGTMRLDAHAVNVETTGIDHVESVTGRSEDVLQLIAQLSDRLNRGLKLPQLAAAPAPGGAGAAPAPTPTPVTRTAGGARGGQFQAVMLYSRALAEEDKGNREGAVELYRKSLAAFPGNENARARLARLEGGA
jgi:TolB-like protein